MDPEFVAAVARVAHGEKPNGGVARFCRDHGVSRDTFYRYLDRFRAEGTSGFDRRSTAPHHRPTALGPQVAEAVLRARKELADEGRDNGPISICWRLEDTGFTPLPSRASVYRILREHGQILPQPRKKPRTRRRFEFADPNGCWQIDGLEYLLADGTTAWIIQILDDHSRLDLCCHAAPSENGTDAWTALQRAFASYGLPVNLLSDNGLAYSGKHRGRMVDLERRLAALGITTIASSIYHPQTCGKNERAHQTLRKWLAARPPAENLTELQHLLEQYRTTYNNRRHQALDGQTPQQRYDARPKATPNPAHSHSGHTQRPVSPTGVIAFSGCSIVVGRRWNGHTADLYWQHDRVTIMINNQHIRTLDLDRSVRYQRLTTKPSDTS